MKTVGIVLAGGMSTRFGSPKAFAKWNDLYFYEVSIQALNPIADLVVVVARPEYKDAIKGTETVITDCAEYCGCGPLAGIYSVMREFPADRYAVLPCDMPFMEKDIMKKMLDLAGEEDVLAVEENGKRHPLAAIYSSRVKDRIERELANGQYSVMKLLGQLDSRWVNGSQLTAYPEEIFRNMNTPDTTGVKGRESNGNQNY